MLSPKAEPWYPRAVDSAFGAEAGASPDGNKKEPALGAGPVAGTTGAEKGEGSGAWELPAEDAEGGTRRPSDGLQAALPGLGPQNSRSDCSFWNRGHWLFPAESLEGAVGAGSARPKQSSSSSSRQRALLVLLGVGVTSAWLEEWLRPGPEV